MKKISDYMEQFRHKQKTEEKQRSTHRPGEFWHDLDKCGICLRTFLPQIYEERLGEMEKGKNQGRIVRDLPKPRGKGVPFEKQV